MEKDRGMQAACDTCAYYSYDEEYECYICDMDLDEDELVRFLSDIISVRITGTAMNMQ